MAPRWLALAVLALVGSGCGGVDSAVDSDPSAGGRRLERYGIRITVPDGWNARLTRGTAEVSTVPLDSPSQPLPLADDDVAVTLFEFEPDPASYPVADLDRAYSDGPPRPFVADEFGPSEEPSGGVLEHGFTRRSFRLAGRRFDLFVEAGAMTPPTAAVAELNALVASLDVTRGDFYPGSVEPPQFPLADGWHVGFAGGGPTRAADYAQAWAATVPYANAPGDLPPVRTLETLPTDGILIWVGLARDNRYAPTSERRRDKPRVTVPLRLGEMQGGWGWEGQVRDISLYRLHGLVPERYHVDAWVFFGDREPTPEQRARAQAMLDRLDLPDWGRWELDGRGDAVVSKA